MLKVSGLLNKISEKTWFGFAIVLFMAVMTVALPISLGGFRKTLDMESHLNFVYAFRAAITEGGLYPAWANDNLGFGSVGIRFYPPLSSFMTALLLLASGDWHFAFSFSMFVWMCVGCFGMYLFIREWGTSVQGIFAGILYAVAPYHIAQVYRFFLYAEFAAMAVLPFFFLYLTRVCRRGNWRDVFPLAVTSAVLILTHIPVTVMVGLSLVVCVPILIDRRRWRSILPQLLCSALAAAAATMFYWIRVVTEVMWVAHSDTQYTVAGYRLGPTLFPYTVTDYDTTFMSYLRHLDIVTVLTMALLMPSVVVFIAGHRRVRGHAARVLAAVSLSAAFGSFMFSKPSAVLWTSIEILQRIQYPWRWLALVTALAVASVALSLPNLVEAVKISRTTLVYAAVILILTFIAVDVRQIRGTGYRISRGAFNELAVDVRSRGVAEHWWPVWAKGEAFAASDPVFAGNRDIKIEEWVDEQRRFTIGEGDAGTIRLATFFYPYWRASVNSRTVEPGMDENGTITLPIGEERSDVELRFEEPAVYSAAAGCSVAVWLFLLGAMIVRRIKLSRLDGTAARG
jgi:hypothetical protein